jgi:2-phospho-L-lactate guanylyltransferase
VIRAVDLVVPVKPLHLAKTRLRGLLTSDEDAHRRLALAVARDTIAAATKATAVRRVLAICSDPAAVAVLRSDSVDVVADEPDAGLNAALRHGTQLLRRAAGDHTAIGALHADLPALRPAELDAALAVFAQTGAARAFCPDRAGTGSTLLLARPGAELDPRFGHGSATAHADSGALRLDGPWPSLQCDVDTEDDLAEAARLGLGRHTSTVLADQNWDRVAN